MREALSGYSLFGSLSLLARFVQLRFGSLAGADVRHRPDKFDVARRIRYRMRGSMNMFDRTVGHQQSISVREVLSVAGRAVDSLLYAHTIIRVNALQDCIEPDRRGPLALDQAKTSHSPVRDASGTPARPIESPLARVTTVLSPEAATA